ncbi:MAG TPA: Gfo/Idh/MocA family oxidoreductase [Vicinamibacterales bacterium]|nr:Gfo/Idh/MocA family oxidoreductase [Vicinamibacterales bacterium]
MTIHFGLIGAGNISDTHARALHTIPGAEMAAVYAPVRARAEQFAARHGGAAFDALEPMLARRPLDVVVIGTPSGLHAEHGIVAAEHGLHVLVEKPIDVTTARADALIETAARSGVTLGVIFQDRLKPDVQRLKALVDGGRLGTPILANARVKWYRPPAYYRDSRWRGTWALDGGGALINQGVHTVDLLLWLFGPVRRVFAKTIAALHAIEVEDTAVAVLEFANGAIGTLEAATSAYPGYSRQIELTGSNGTVRLDGDDLVAVDLKDARDDERPSRPQADRAPTASAASPVVADPAAHARVFEDFIRAVAERRAPCCDGSGGRESVRLVEAMYESSRTTRPAMP